MEVMDRNVRNRSKEHGRFFVYAKVSTTLLAEPIGHCTFYRHALTPGHVWITSYFLVTDPVPSHHM